MALTLIQVALLLGPRLINCKACVHGDPLFDFVPLFVSCLDCDATLCKGLFKSYLRRLHMGQRWPKRPAEISLSYFMMCYTILHEE